MCQRETSGTCADDHHSLNDMALIRRLLVGIGTIHLKVV